ncbi:peroxiredoxin [Chitinibacter sp. S2-10]|uniref:peroxiredoxin n=1 Tax=Chitinibacter sp. S2-10 TaxID=3373597 RepID=UPI00397750EA
MTTALCAALKLPTTNNGEFDLSQLTTPYAVIYFYPKDNTPGCTTETADFRDHYQDFLATGAAVFGVSRDSIKSHENFKAKLAVPFELISDAEESACAAFDVMKMKNMYGKQVRGIERSTFVINASGEILREWRGVKVANHVAEVLGFVAGLK